MLLCFSLCFDKKNILYLNLLSNYVNISGSLLFPSNSSQNSSISNQIGFVSVARALSESLTSQPCLSPTSPITSNTMTTLVHMHKDVTEMLDMIQLPPPSHSDDQLSTRITRLVHSLINCSHWLGQIAHLEVHHSHDAALQCQDKLKSNNTNLNNIVRRILQGVDKDITNLVEEEMVSLSKQIEKTITEVTSFSICASLPIPEVSLVSKTKVLCDNYLNGLADGCILQIESAFHTAEVTASSFQSSLDDSVLSSYGTDLISIAHACLSKISVFLEKLSNLSVAIPITQSETYGKVKDDILTFVANMQATSDNLHHIKLSLWEISDQLSYLCRGKSTKYLLIIIIFFN